MPKVLRLVDAHVVLNRPASGADTGPAAVPSLLCTAREGREHETPLLDEVCIQLHLTMALAGGVDKPLDAANGGPPCRSQLQRLKAHSERGPARFDQVPPQDEHARSGIRWPKVDAAAGLQGPVRLQQGAPHASATWHVSLF